MLRLELYGGFCGVDKVRSYGGQKQWCSLFRGRNPFGEKWSMSMKTNRSMTWLIVVLLVLAGGGVAMGQVVSSDQTQEQSAVAIGGGNSLSGADSRSAATAGGGTGIAISEGSTFHFAAPSPRVGGAGIPIPQLGFWNGTSASGSTSPGDPRLYEGLYKYNLDGLSDLFYGWKCIPPSNVPYAIKGNESLRKRKQYVWGFVPNILGDISFNKDEQINKRHRKRLLNPKFEGLTYDVSITPRWEFKRRVVKFGAGYIIDQPVDIRFQVVSLGNVTLAVDIVQLKRNFNWIGDISVDASGQGVLAANVFSALRKIATPYPIDRIVISKFNVRYSTVGSSKSPMAGSLNYAGANVGASLGGGVTNGIVESVAFSYLLAHCFKSTMDDYSPPMSKDGKYVENWVEIHPLYKNPPPVLQKDSQSSDGGESTVDRKKTVLESSR